MFQQKKKKKMVTALAIAAMCCIPSTMVEAAMPFGYQGKLTPNIASAFTKVLEDDIYKRLHVTRLGEIADNNAPDEVFTACELVDFEGDNIPELLVIYPAQSNPQNVHIEVWQWNGKKAERIVSQQYENKTFHLLKAQGKIYLSHTPEEIYGIQNHVWTKVKAIKGTLSDAIGEDSFTFQDAMQLYKQLSPRYAVPSAAKLNVDGKYYDLNVYNIAGKNYFKARDIAQLMVGTPKEASLEGDGNGIRIGLSMTDAPDDKYQSTGSELKKTPMETTIADRQLTENYSGVIQAVLPHNRLTTEAYNINGHNYFSIQDLSVLFDFHVKWDNATKTIFIDTNADAI